MSGAGSFTHRLAFLEGVTTRNAFGEDETTEWVQRLATYGRLIYQSGGEGVEAARLAGRQAIKVKIRKSEAAMQIGTGWQMRNLSRETLWDIKEVDADTQRDHVFLIVEGPIS